MRLARCVCAALLILLTESAAEAQFVAQRLISKNITSGGTDCSVATNCQSLPDVFRTRDGTIQISGTWVGTVQFEGTVDGTNWASLLMTPLAGGATVTSATGNNVWTFAAALVGVRVRCSTFTSGTIVVSIVAR